MIQPTPHPVEHEENDGRGAFFVEREGRRIAELTYSASGKEAIVGHTWVDPSLRGSGLAPVLVDAVADWARASDRKIVPVCSYVRALFERSDRYADVWRR